jgi:hypothetical protein
MEDKITFKPKSQEVLMQEALEFLEDTRFAFACFVDHFKRWVELNEGFKGYMKEKK